ncbi:MAG: protein translocase subunit SecF [Endozoicomonadaceae bacterium]|nr:protein translocase subunit SecF [Endozoicomonadaceae bacterium]MBE8232144.1 protein translocase subunit SecF [Endozoicomonadaceae bacterium]
MKKQHVLNYMKWRHIATFISAVLVIFSLFSLALKGLNWGLDFTGGTLIELQFKNTPLIKTIRQDLSQLGYPDTIVQQIGSSNILNIRMTGGDQQLNQNVIQQIIERYPDDSDSIMIKRTEYIGPQVGESLKEQGGLGLLLALALITLYIAFRFQIKFSFGALISLLHDVVIVLGVFSFFHLTCDLNVLAAILSVIGYSLNDTIVVYDRIRENYRKLRNIDSISIMNISLTQIFGRTVATSATTAVVLVSLYFLGGDSLHNFSLALLVGIFVGTYSSIYIAANLLLLLRVERKDLLIQPVSEHDAPS